MKPTTIEDLIEKIKPLAYDSGNPYKWESIKILITEAKEDWAVVERRRAVREFIEFEELDYDLKTLRPNS